MEQKREIKIAQIVILLRSEMRKRTTVTTNASIDRS